MEELRKLTTWYIETIDPYLPRPIMIIGIALSVFSLFFWYLPTLFKNYDRITPPWALIIALPLTLITVIYWIIFTIVAINKARQIEKDKKYKDNVIISTEHGHKDMQDVKKLYNYYFPSKGGNPSFSEVNTWIKETDSLNGKYKDNQVLDFLLLAKINSVVCGFLIVTYYYGSNSFAFVSYLMVDWKTKDKNIRNKLSTVSDDIADYLRDNLLSNQLKGCTGIVAETSRKIDKSSKIIKKPEIYIGDFRDIIRRAINSEMWENELFHYLQPNAPKQNPLRGNEREMFLLYARTNKHPDFINKKNIEPDDIELMSIFDFTYKTIYWDSCQYNKKLEIKYREYLTELHNKVWSNYEKQQTKDLTHKNA